MAYLMISRSLIICSAMMLVLLLSTSSAMAQLDICFYSKTCPHVEAIVREEMLDILGATPTLAGPHLRLHFHNCFVLGCDASMLFDTADSASPVEKDASPNKSLRGFGSMQWIKDRLEKECPASTVSCADVLALMAHDAVVLVREPSPTGSGGGTHIGRGRGW